MSDSLRLFNTLSMRKERFVPLRPRRVGMFVCGPTVQSRIHMGHARTYVFYDALVRHLRYIGYDVDYLMNITDFDERITLAAVASKESPVDLARRFQGEFIEDMASLRCTSVSRFEPVSAHVDTMIRQVATLVEKGAAYVTEGWVYFDTSKFRGFGRLSHQSKRELALRPLELSAKKRHMTDFALWRPEVLVEGKWQSPWGLGSPGWHIQDTAVSIPLLGGQYDVHGGALELVYPHHEAEIAQAESLTEVRPFVKYWIHTHHLNMQGRKMSKSIGNVLTVKDALKHYSVDELRLFLLATHYRRDMDLSGMDASSKRLTRMRHSAAAILDGAKVRPGDLAEGEPLPEFVAAMNDDLNTPRAIEAVEEALEKGADERNPGRRRAIVSSAVSHMRNLGVELIDGS